MYVQFTKGFRSAAGRKCESTCIFHLPLHGPSAEKEEGQARVTP